MFMSKRKQVIRCLLMVVCCALQSSAGDAGRVIRSVVFPGMGQLGDGHGEITSMSTVKGLGFMALEGAFLSMGFSELSHKNSYARNTVYLNYKYQMAPNYSDRLKMYDSWNEAFKKSNDAKTLMYAFFAGAAVVWGVNVADILLFVPKDTESSLLKTISKNTALCFGVGSASCTYTYSF
jgi:hypothetical protein